MSKYLKPMTKEHMEQLNAELEAMPDDQIRSMSIKAIAHAIIKMEIMPDELTNEVVKQLKQDRPDHDCANCPEERRCDAPEHQEYERRHVTQSPFKGFVN